MARTPRRQTRDLSGFSKTQPTDKARVRNLRAILLEEKRFAVSSAELSETRRAQLGCSSPIVSPVVPASTNSLWTLVLYRNPGDGLGSLARTRRGRYTSLPPTSTGGPWEDGVPAGIVE